MYIYISLSELWVGFGLGLGFRLGLGLGLRLGLGLYQTILLIFVPSVFFGNSKVGVWCLYIAVVVYIVVAFGVLCYRFDLVVDAAVRLCRILVFFFWGFTVYCLLSLINCCTTVDVSISATDERCRYCLIRLVLNV